MSLGIVFYTLQLLKIDIQAGKKTQLTFLAAFMEQKKISKCIFLKFLKTTTIEWSRASVVGTGGPRFESRARHSFSVQKKRNLISEDYIYAYEPSQIKCEERDRSDGCAREYSARAVKWSKWLVHVNVCSEYWSNVCFVPFPYVLPW